MAEYWTNALIPWPIYTETDLVLRARGQHERALAFLGSVVTSFEMVVPLSARELSAALTLLTKYADLGIDLPDASVIALSMEADLPILTWDFRHFRAVVTSRGVGLRLDESQMPQPR